MKVYLAGPMTGIADLNRAAFNKAAGKLREEGHEVFNPAAANLEWMHKTEILLHELTWILREAEAIVMLPGWSYSKGARLEHEAALFKGIEVILL